MTRYEKLAWFNFAIIAGTAAILIPCIFLMGACLGFLVATALGSIGYAYGEVRFLNKRGVPRSQLFDERDESIGRRAIVLSGLIAYCSVIIACTLVPVFSSGGVSPFLPFVIVVTGYYLYKTVFSILVLVFYRKGAADA